MLWISLLGLAGCASTPQTAAIQADPPPLASRHLIAEVPFYPQQDYYCGPTTLAEVFNYYGLTLSPEQVAPDLFIPALEGSLQIEMVAAARKQGFLAYAAAGNLAQLLSLLAQDIPVIVLQNLGTAWFPVWHYALVIGYDLEREQLVLHSGTTANYKTGFKLFERTWQRGGHWLLAAVPPSTGSTHFDSFIYTKAAQDLIAVGQSATGAEALANAAKQWPRYWLPYFLLGNHFLDQDVAQSIRWFEQGLAYAQNQPAYLNNYAHALSRAGCKAQALAQIEQGLQLAADDENLKRSYAQIAAQEPAACLAAR